MAKQLFRNLRRGHTMPESLGNCPDCLRPYGLRRRCYRCNPGNPGGNRLRVRSRDATPQSSPGRRGAVRPKINLDGFVLTPDRIRTPRPKSALTNGHTATLDRSRSFISSAGSLDPDEADFDPSTLKRAVELRSEKAAAEVLPTESPAEMLRRIHAERAEAEREKTRRERAEAMKSPVSSVSAPLGKAATAPLFDRSGNPASSPVAQSKSGVSLTNLASGNAGEEVMPGVTVASTSPDAPSIDPEIHAIAAAHAALCGLDGPSIRRALNYLGCKLLERMPGVAG